MLADDIRRAVMAASRDRLTEISQALWQAFGAGALTEDEAAELSALVAARRTVPAAPAAKPKRPPRPRDPVEVERRRKWAASGWLPPKLAARFTPAETAALAVVAWLCAREGRCAYPIGRIASLAGVSRTKVKDAIRLARSLGLLAVQERRLTRWRSDTNVVRIACGTWLAWIDGVRGRRLARGLGGGVGKATALNTGDNWKGAGGRGNRTRLPGGRKGDGMRTPLPALQGARKGAGVLFGTAQA